MHNFQILLDSRRKKTINSVITLPWYSVITSCRNHTIAQTLLTSELAKRNVLDANIL